VNIRRTAEVLGVTLGSDDDRLSAAMALYLAECGGVDCECEPPESGVRVRRGIRAVGCVERGRRDIRPSHDW